MHAAEQSKVGKQKSRRFDEQYCITQCPCVVWDHQDFQKPCQVVMPTGGALEAHVQNRDSVLVSSLVPWQVWKLSIFPVECPTFPQHQTQGQSGCLSVVIQENTLCLETRTLSEPHFKPPLHPVDLDWKEHSTVVDCIEQDKLQCTAICRCIRLTVARKSDLLPPGTKSKRTCSRLNLHPKPKEFRILNNLSGNLKKSHSQRSTSQNPPGMQSANLRKSASDP